MIKEHLDDVTGARQDRGMTHFLISFPSAAMVISDEDFPDVVRDSHAVIQEAKDAGETVRRSPSRRSAAGRKA